jgi:multiple sugar transport system ATP-binding protein
MAPVTIRNVKKEFGSVAVIHGVDFEIDDGQFVVLVGPSGCGKSTLLRMIAGLESISDGEIRIGGRLVNTVAPKDRDVAMVFQSYALYPHMSVADNMGFALKLAGRDKAEIEERVARAAAILDLEPLLRRLPKQLSGGQRQRVAMGRAIVRDPEVFLFDEPLSNLDAKLRVLMRSEIKALHQRLGTTTVYVTHDQVEAMTMANTIVVMRDGLVEQTGQPLDLYDFPANVFVAGFIGSPAMNMIEGTISKDGLVTDDGVVLPVRNRKDLREGRRATYGIRPEHIERCESGLEAVVVTVEPTGAESLIVLRLGTQQVTCVLKERVHARPGDIIRISPIADTAHLFDAQSGKRIDGRGPIRQGSETARPVREAPPAAAPARGGDAVLSRTPLKGLIRKYFGSHGSYRPELHYMRGPSPRTLAHRRPSQPDTD